MPFVKGRSGNPRGRPARPKAGPDKVRADLLRQAPEILNKLIELAKDGDPQSAKIVLDRCLPALRATDRPVSLALGSDLAEAAKAVLAALGTGTLTPSEASSLANTLGALARTSELIEVEKRLTAIESLLHEHKNRSQN